MRGLAAARVAPFGLDRLIARLQLPGHVSPLSASFLGTRPLGIPPLPCFAWYIMLWCTSASAFICDGILELARFGKIEITHHAMRLSKCDVDPVSTTG